MSENVSSDFTALSNLKAKSGTNTKYNRSNGHTNIHDYTNSSYNR